jgi:predicted metal-dependent hydrolase
MEYEIIRTRRKTIAIHIKDCRVIVRAGMRTPAREIDRFVSSKQDWIEKHLAEQRERAIKRAGFELGYGSTVLYLGREYLIEADSEPSPEPYSRSSSASYSESSPAQHKAALYFPPGLNETQLRKKLLQFYKEQAEKILPERIACFSPLLGVKPKGLRIGSAKRSWGSCTAAGRLTFSWRLMMASLEAIDYVVVHELVHLKQLNHSTRFWAIVEHIMPDWKERRKKLRLLQKRLSGEIW